MSSKKVEGTTEILRREEGTNVEKDTKKHVIILRSIAVKVLSKLLE